MLHGITLAPLYDTLGEETVKIVLEEVNTNTLCLSNDHVELICTMKKAGALQNLNNLILMDAEDN